MSEIKASNSSLLEFFTKTVKLTPPTLGFDIIISSIFYQEFLHNFFVYLS